MQTPSSPPARRDDLVIQQLPGETLLYDPQTHRAHCLNRPAAAVWQACDGARGPEAVRAAAEAALGRPLAPEACELALNQLHEAGLLRRGASPSPRVNRRDLMRKLGTAALVPAILSLTAPPAEAAASNCRTRLQSCTGAGQGTCCAGLNCLGGICL